MIFELPAGLPHTALHHLSPQPAPYASLTQCHNDQVSSPSSLPSPSLRLRCLRRYFRCVALGTQQQHPLPLLSPCSLPRLNLLCCYRRRSSITKRRLGGGADGLILYALAASGRPPRQPSSLRPSLKGCLSYLFLSYSYESLISSC